jgi:hypothetical protein
VYDVNQIHDPIKGIPNTLRGMDPGAPIGRQPVAARIEDLANQAATAGRELTEAREEYQRAALMREQATKRFISVSEALFQAIQEHREGTPEGVPYPR